MPRHGEITILNSGYRQKTGTAFSQWPLFPPDERVPEHFERHTPDHHCHIDQMSTPLKTKFHMGMLGL